MPENKCCSPENNIKQFFIDPSSGQYSMSRLCVGFIVIILMPFYFYMKICGIDIPSDVMIALITTLSAAYGLNSAAGAYTRTQPNICCKEEEKKPMENESCKKSSLKDKLILFFKKLKFLKD